MTADQELRRIAIGDAIVTMRDGALMTKLADTLERRLINGEIGEREAFGFCMCFATVVSMAGGAWPHAARRQ